MAKSQTWADGPIKMIPTPASTRDINSHYAIAMATEMACVHNALLRAFNSILLQAPHIPSYDQPNYIAQDVQDLLFFTDSLIRLLEHHHAGEENVLFPALEREIGIEGYLQVAVDQHEVFHKGLHELWDLVKRGRERPEEWRWEGMKGVIDGFMPALELHLKEEVELILSLEKFPEEGLRKAWDDSVEEGKKVGFGAFYDMFPVMLGSHDSTFGHGPVFPPVPHALRYLVNYGTSWKHKGAWRFCPCDMWSKPRPLHFLK